MNNEDGEGRDAVDRETEKSESVKIKDDDDPFIVVKARKSRRKPREKAASSFHHDIGDCNSDEREVTETKVEVVRKINNCTSHVRSSEYYSKFLEKVTVELAKEVEGFRSENLNIFCLGLGSISSHLLSRISRYQLALLILLKEEFQAPVEVFDPVFNAQEQSILSVDYGFEVSKVNEEGKRVVETPTLIFMPHCPHQLINNLLYANWSPESLQHCYIVSNSISEAISTVSRKYLDKHLYYLVKAHTICKEIPLPNTFTDHPDIFNDIALHVFPSKNFLNQTEDFWLNKPCPIYTEQDFISNDSKK